jgi:ATP-dependent DNA helicase PIF1
VLVVDEVSMMDEPFFVYMEKALRSLRPKHHNKPFGGVQLVFFGDFFQLPPVNKPSPSYNPRDRETSTKYLFECQLWQTAIKTHVQLTTVFRQEQREFQQLLELVRYGQCPPSVTQTLRNTQPPPADAPIKYTKLYGKRVDVNFENTERLKQCPGKIVTLKLKFDIVRPDTTETYTNLGVDRTQAAISSVVKNLQVEHSTDLKIGAQVMLVANMLEVGLGNGSRGVVGGFQNSTSFPIVDFQKIKNLIILPHTWRVSQQKYDVLVVGVPLRLAYALTIHKSQGQSIDGLFVETDGMWEYGQCYTALSRATSLATLQVANFDAGRVKAHPAVIKFYKQKFGSALANRKRKLEAK